MNIFDRYFAWRKYHRTCAELSALSNRELKDIGIKRCDIPSVARTKSRICW